MTADPPRSGAPLPAPATGTPEARLAEIRAREQAATPGPWLQADTTRRFWEEKRTVYCAHGAQADPPRVLLQLNPWFPHESDAEFIAHARADIPWLLARLAEVEARLADEETAGQEVVDELRAWQRRAGVLGKALRDELLADGHYRECPVVTHEYMPTNPSVRRCPDDDL